jgi:SRSO17 transposase
VLRPEQWLLIEWPVGQDEPSKYYLATLPAETSLEELVSVAHQRWRIERDYQDLKQDFGLGHYEGRGWRGFHHHAALCIASYAFLMAERIESETPGGIKKNSALRKIPALPKEYAPRGSPRSATRANVDNHPATSPDL